MTADDSDPSGFDPSGSDPSVSTLAQRYFESINEPFGRFDSKKVRAPTGPQLILGTVVFLVGRWYF